MLELALADGANDLVGNRSNSVVSKADGDRLHIAMPGDALFRKPGLVKRLLNDRRVVLAAVRRGNVVHAGPAHNVGRVDLGRVGPEMEAEWMSCVRSYCEEARKPQTETFPSPLPPTNVLARLDDAVAGHDDGSRKLGKLEFLQLPSAAVVASEVRVLFQLWVAVCRQLRV
jgi:hypothetical protein